jgi:hypothetical protein
VAALREAAGSHEVEQHHVVDVKLAFTEGHEATESTDWRLVQGL